MLELSAAGGELWRMGFAGDTFNAAWYARALLPADEGVAYVTALGDDPFSERLRAFMAAGGIATDRIRPAPNRRPGLYVITLDGAERSFSYWRGESAARLLADDPDWLAEALSGVRQLYVSGITLAILTPPARERLLAELARQRALGSRVAFDPNFRAALWPDRDVARAAMQAAYAVADTVLPTFPDEAELFGDASPEATAERIAAFGVGEVVVKNGAEACLVVAEERRETVAPPAAPRLVDTSGAGDAFSGSYLAGRLLGMDPFRAARLGHAVAAKVIAVPGALARIDGPALLAKLD